MPRALLPWIVPLLLLLGWQLAGTFDLVPPTVLAPPSAVLGALVAKLADLSLLRDLGVSFARAVAGLLVGGGIGFALGLATGTSATLRSLLDPTLQMVRNVPHLALIPLVIIWFGIGEGARLFLVALGVFFPIYLNTYHGIRTVDPQLIEMARVYGMRPGQLFRRVLLPGALPSILVGVRYALGIMWLTLIVAETIAADAGIGHMAMAAREFSRTDVIVLSVLIYALLGKLADSATRLLERHLLAWNSAYAAA